MTHTVTAHSGPRSAPAAPSRSGNAAPAKRGPSTRKAILTPTMVGFVIGTLFVAVFLAAFHSPQPKNLPVGIVGPAEQTETVQRAFEEDMPGAVAFTDYPTVGAARHAVESRDVYGAYVIAADGTSALLCTPGRTAPPSRAPSTTCSPPSGHPGEQ